MRIDRCLRGVFPAGSDCYKKVKMRQEGVYVKNENNIGLAQARAKSTAEAATVFLIPALLLITIYIIYPVIDTFVISGYKWNGISSDRIFIGTENWVSLFKDEMFWKSFKHNLIVMVFSILLQIPMGMLLATFLDAGGKKFNIFKIIWFLPYLMSSVAIAFLFVYALATNGGIVSSLATLIMGKKTTIDLLGTAPNALYTVIGVMAWQFTPFYMVYFIAGYGNIDTTIYEAAIIDGASRAQILVQMIIPLSKPIIIYTALVAFMAPWCDYIFASYVAFGYEKGYNVAVAMTRWVWTNDYQGFFTRFCAGGILVAVPVTILFMCLQKYYVEGVTGGAVKG